MGVGAGTGLVAGAGTGPVTGVGVGAGIGFVAGPVTGASTGLDATSAQQRVATAAVVLSQLGAVPNLLEPAVAM